MVDIHNRSRHLVVAVKFLLNNKSMLQENKQKILDSKEYCVPESFSVAGQLLYLQEKWQGWRTTRATHTSITRSSTKPTEPVMRRVYGTMVVQLGPKPGVFSVDEQHHDGNQFTGEPMEDLKVMRGG